MRVLALLKISLKFINAILNSYTVLEGADAAETLCRWLTCHFKYVKKEKKNTHKKKEEEKEERKKTQVLHSGKQPDPISFCSPRRFPHLLF